MAELLSKLSIVSYVISVICFVLAIVLWFKFDIPAVINDLSGKTARKSIQQIRERNEKSGNKSYRPSSVNAERGKLTSSIPVSKRTQLNEDERPETGLMNENMATSVDFNETGTLADETSGLTDDGTTAPLSKTMQMHESAQNKKTLIMIENVMLIHTSEVID